MLGKLFGSNARVKILKLFLLHPEQKYYIRQLARNLKLQVNSVRRELENLEKFGLLISSAELDSDNHDEEERDNEDFKKLINGEIVRSKKLVDSVVGKKKSANSAQSKKYYQANKKFVLFEEIKALIIKAQILYEKDFIEKFKKTGNPKLFVLTGFFVNSLESPIDMLIVGRVNKVKFLKIIKSLETEIGRELNFTIMDLKEFRYRKDITDVFLYNILEGKNMIIIDEVGVK